MGFRYMVRYTVWEYRGQRSINTGLWVPYSTPVSGTRISWPMAISRYLAPIEARLVRAFLFPFFPADLRVFDLMVRSFPLRGVRFFR